MAAAAPTALILGHSFVKRLKRDLNSGFDRRAARDFRLHGTASVCLHGIGGRTVHSLRAYDLHVVKDLAPDVIILEIGTNDLSHAPPEVVGSTISVSLWAINFFFFFFFFFSRQRQVGPAAGPSRTRASPRASVRASTAASAGAARGAPAGTTPNATPVTDGESHTQITPQEALLSSQFMETLVNRVTEEVSRRLAPAPTPPAPSPPVPTSDLQEVPAGPLADKTAPTPSGCFG